MKLGYIGMGIMGSPMAINLLKAGHEVTVWNRTKDKCNAAVEAGAKAADSPQAMAKSGAEVIFLNVTNTPDVEQVVFGAQGIATGAQPGLIVVDNSTINPQATQQFAARLAEQQVQWVDAPVSGGDIGAINGTLSIMVGGPRDAYEKVLPLLEVLGKSVTHLGDAGAGQACKACNQVAVFAALMGTCEAIALAQQLGLDPAKMIQVVSSGAGGSWQLENLGPKIAAEDFAPGFMIDLAQKDLGIVLEAAQSLGLELQATELAGRRFQSIQDSGGGREGTQAMAKAVRVKVKP